MKVYFSSSMRAKKLFQDIFENIYHAIEELGYKHTSDYLLKADAEQFYKRKPTEEKRFYQSMVKQIKAADVCVFEVSRHSLGIGYSVNLALDFGKPVILLYQSGHRPYLFSALNSDKLIMSEYAPHSLKTVIKSTLSEAKDNIDIRFTFFITPEINQFLRYITRQKNTPRAVYLRDLLAREMGKSGFR
jgi:hypothetical protein